MPSDFAMQNGSPTDVSPPPSPQSGPLTELFFSEEEYGLGMIWKCFLGLTGASSMYGVVNIWSSVLIHIQMFNFRIALGVRLTYTIDIIYI